MKKKELKKIYKYNHIEKEFTIDVQLNDYRDAYSDWDFSPYTNRDLDEGLTEYLLDCSNEVPLKYNIRINFHILNQSKNEAREKKSLIGMHNYFKYQLKKMKNKKIRLIRDIITFLILGSILLLLGFYFDGFFGESLLISILSEGFFIGGWVMLWEMFSAWFFELKKIGNRTKHFQRLNESLLVYSYAERGEN